MIFVTVGSMLPFNRLITCMDKWAKDNDVTDVFAQIGDGSYVPRHMEWTRMIGRQDFLTHVRDASLIVAHAGMGSILTAAEFRKPIVLLPRFAAAREHTTDHQVHTAKWLSGRPGIYVAMTDAELIDRIGEALHSPIGQSSLTRSAPESFLDRIRQFLD